MIAITTPITAQVSRKTPINTIVFAGGSASEVDAPVIAVGGGRRKVGRAPECPISSAARRQA